MSMDLHGLSSLGCARQRLWRFEAVYTGFKGTDRYLLSVSHTPLEHKLGVNRTPPQELSGNKSTTKKKSQTSQRIMGLLTEDKIDFKPKSAMTDVTKKTPTARKPQQGAEEEKKCVASDCTSMDMWPQLVHSTVRHIFQCLPKRPPLLFPVMEWHCVLKAVLLFPYSFAKIHRLLLPSVDTPMNPIISNLFLPRHSSSYLGVKKKKKKTFATGSKVL